ncbi:uncharacterized protein V1516DRAFT_632145 [Lipomyces oligophaga]|uniref:uncharacterized protein n=1 Tax=Lipomyces oligophaga TaxID=45792 RepID=UPI0034CF7D7E
MSLAPVILPFTHWPVSYHESLEPSAADLPESPASGSQNLISTLAHLPSDIVLTCATVFSRGVILGLINGSIEILQWDEVSSQESSHISTTSLSPLSTTAGHRNSPVVALRRIAAKDTEGRSELLISAAENGDILKHSLPSGRVLMSTRLPFRPIGIITLDSFLIVFGSSTEIRFLHQSTLESHIVMDGMLQNWPIPLPLFGERLVTLDHQGCGMHWKIWPEEARVERITNHGAPIRLLNHARQTYMSSANRKPGALPRKMSNIIGRDVALIRLGNTDYGSIISVHTVGDILWLLVQTNGWCLYMWEEDKFMQVEHDSLPGIASAATSDAVDDRYRNWFGVWDHSGNLTFVTVLRSGGKSVCDIHYMKASPKPNRVNSLFMAFSYTTMHLPSQHLLNTPWVVEPRDIVIEFFFSNGEVRYRIGDLITFTWNSDSYPIHRPSHFFTQMKPATSFEFETYTPDSVNISASSQESTAEGQIPEDSDQSDTSLNSSKNNIHAESNLPLKLDSRSSSQTAKKIELEPMKSPTSGPCTTGIVFTDKLVFGAGSYINFYSLTRYLLAFESPERSLRIPEPGTTVTHLSSIQLKSGLEVLVIGTSNGIVYLFDSQSLRLSSRIAVSGSPVQFAMLLKGQNEASSQDLAVIASRDGASSLINLRQQKLIFTIPGHYSQIKLLASPKHTDILLILYEDSYSRICNIKNGIIENQNFIDIESEEDWEISYVRERPLVPEHKLIYTDARYTINGSSTVFINMYVLLDQIGELKRALIPIDTEKVDFTIPVPEDSPSLLSAKALISAMYSWRKFTDLDSDERIDNSGLNSLVNNTVLIDLLFLRRFSALRSQEGNQDAARESIPAKLGSRGIGNSLTVFHAHQNLLQISGEITSMVYLTCVALARVLLEAQLSTIVADHKKSAGASKTAELVEPSQLIEVYFHRFVTVLFNLSETVEGSKYKRPWLRGFARFWNSDRDEIRTSSRICLSYRLNQLGFRTRELSMTVSRWRILLPGVYAPKRNLLAANSAFLTKRRMSGGGSSFDEPRLSLDCANSISKDEIMGIDEMIDDDGLSSVLGGSQGEDDCEEAISESSILAVIILGNIAIKFSNLIAHSTHREVTEAIYLFLMRTDLDGEVDIDDSDRTKELQNIAIELIGIGWGVWSRDKYFDREGIIKRLADLLGSSKVSLSTARTKSKGIGMANESSTLGSSSSGAGMPLSREETKSREVKAIDFRRHQILLKSIREISQESINMVVEVCSKLIATAPNPQVRIGAVRFIFYIVKQEPGLLVDRLFPIIEATIAALDPSVSAIRNKVVTSITLLFNILVTTYPVVASHRAQQRLALALRPDIVLVYDLRAGIQLASLEGCPNQCLEIQFSPEGRHVAGIDRVTSQVYVWKLGHSFLSMIQSIGGSSGVSGMHTSSYGFRYGQSYGSVESKDRDLVFPRFVGQLAEPVALGDLKSDNAGLSITFKQEKLFEISIPGRPNQVFDFINT